MLVILAAALFCEPTLLRTRSGLTNPQEAVIWKTERALPADGQPPKAIASFRSNDNVNFGEEFKAGSTNFYPSSDDGSHGEKRMANEKVKKLIDAGNKYDMVLAIGPIPMMKFVCKTTEPYGIKTMVSLNPIMIDGTGMCGGCRVNVGGEIKFACVDGPDFDGHLIKFDELIQSNSTYREMAAHDESYYRLYKVV